MPVSALIVSLPVDPAMQAAALVHMQADPRITLGERVDLRLAIVAETTDPLEDEALFEELQRFDGLALELVFYDFSDIEGVTALPERRPRRRFDSETPPAQEEH